MGPRTAREYGREVRRAEKLGRKAEFLTVETVRTMPWKCEAHRVQKQLELEPASVTAQSRREGGE
jgi:hypothetical protein